MYVVNNMLINIIQHKRTDFKGQFDIWDLYTQKIEKFDMECYNVNIESQYLKRKKIKIYD